jgi:hypothetical protein
MIGIGITILGTMIVALWTWRLPRLLSRLAVTVLAALVIACVAYWLSSLFSSSYEVSSWEWMIISVYFAGGLVFGVWVLIIMQIVKKVGVKNDAH